MIKRTYNPQVTPLERQLSGIAAMIYQIDSCQAYPYPQDDAIKDLYRIFRETSSLISRLRDAEEYV